jgi:hypothetical protein
MSHVGNGIAGRTLIGTGVTSSSTFAPIGTLSGLTTYGVVLGGGTGAFTSTNAGTAGQVLTSGGAGAPPTYETPAASGVTSITGGPGVTITGTAEVPIVNSVIFTDTAAATLAVDNGYNATAAGTYTMPATAVQGEIIIVFCDTAGAVVLDCPALNYIRIGSLITSSGGTVTSTAIGDSLTLRYRLSSLTWEATSVIGTWLIA